MNTETINAIFEGWKREFMANLSPAERERPIEELWQELSRYLEEKGEQRAKIDPEFFRALAEQGLLAEIKDAMLKEGKP